MQFNHPKIWAFIALFIAMFICAELIFIHRRAQLREQQQMQQNIENHSEIKEKM